MVRRELHVTKLFWVMKTVIISLVSLLYSLNHPVVFQQSWHLNEESLLLPSSYCSWCNVVRSDLMIRHRQYRNDCIMITQIAMKSDDVVFLLVFVFILSFFYRQNDWQLCFTSCDVALSLCGATLPHSSCGGVGGILQTLSFMSTVSLKVQKRTWLVQQLS